MTEIKYQQAKPISSQVVTAWQAWVWHQGHWEHRVALWHKDATIFDVHNFYLARFMQFYVAALDVSEVIVGRVDHCWMPDARWVDRDWNVTLEPPVAEASVERQEVPPCPDYL